MKPNTWNFNLQTHQYSAIQLAFHGWPITGLRERFETVVLPDVEDRLKTRAFMPSEEMHSIYLTKYTYT
jgi:hypothetical protein